MITGYESATDKALLAVYRSEANAGKWSRVRLILAELTTRSRGV